MEIVKNVQETHKIAASIAEKMINGGIVCLYGDLGAGKTEFAKGMAEYFGIEKFSIKSPTYTYIREHKKGNLRIFHIDLYRLEEIDELLAQEIEEIFTNPKNIVIIEWADKMKEYLPKDRIDIKLKYLDKDSREITIN